MSDDEAPAWFKESQRGTFKVGDEVTICLSECPRYVKHGEQEQGVRALVVCVDEDFAPDRTHPILVYYRRPLPVKGRSGFYSAGELRPFDPVAFVLGGS